jgi:glycosyltransferase involved in cell wall biosynthesis
MKILLVGEYSRLHNSLKEGLIEHGHKVTLIGNRDGFKNYDVDIDISPRFFKHPSLMVFVKALNKLFGLNLISLENAYIFHKTLPQLKGYDVVQLYNESCIKSYSKLEIYLLKKLIRNNRKFFLLSCGIDYLSVKYAYEKKFRYSILSPYHENKGLKKYYKYILEKLKPSHQRLHRFLFSQVNGVIASDLDYHLPLLGNPSYKGLIPNPINTKKIDYIPVKTDGKIIIFHGVNKDSYIKKGNKFFDEALAIINEKHPEKVVIHRTENIPYNEYISLYDSCHILLDQVYAYDQGYNALEAMAKGKVVFTGAEKEFLEHYKLKEDEVCINALPNTQSIVEKLEWLILNPEKIKEISIKARSFIEKEHHYIQVAKRYLDVWEKN